MIKTSAGRKQVKPRSLEILKILVQRYWNDLNRIIYNYFLPITVYLKVNFVPINTYGFLVREFIKYKFKFQGQWLDK